MSLPLGLPPALAPALPPAVRAVRAALAAVLITAGGNALSLPGPLMLGRFDFGYSAQGDPAARPVQVFSDGAGTVYFQVAPGAAAPAIFAGRGLALLVPQVRGPYQVVRSRAREFTLALGAARARVVHGGVSAVEPPVDPSGAAPASVPAAPAADPSPPAVEMSDSAGASPSADAAGAQLGRAMREGRQLASLGPGAPERMLRWTEPERTHDAPIVFAAGSALLSPQALAALDALVARLGADARVTLEGRGDVTLHDGLAAARVAALRAAFAARGWPAARVGEQASHELSVSVSGPGTAAPERRMAAVVRWTTPATERTLDADGAGADTTSMAGASSSWDIAVADV
jgi:outer membrane protein OmpA-like peptidoglycan-associated protein